MENQPVINTPTPQEPPKKGSAIVIISMAVFVLISFAALAFLYYQNQQLKQMLASYQTPIISPTPSATINPTESWKKYTNEKYGFEFSYPDNYKVLTDKENLYGWPKAILLLYQGGQSYDMPVEIWDTEAEYKQKYNSGFDVTTFKIDEKFVTFLNQNKTQEVTDIISTFKLLNETTPISSPSPSSQPVLYEMK